MNESDVFARDPASFTYIGLFALAILLLLAGLYVGNWLRDRRKLKRIQQEVDAIVDGSGLSEDEADFMVFVSNENDLNDPMTLYTSLRTFDTLVSRELELILNDRSEAPIFKKFMMGQAYGARKKLFPSTLLEGRRADEQTLDLAGSA
jgi:hypothetical protein